MEKILVIIPAYNASETLSSLIEQILPFFKKEDILVVDDGSVDRTFDIAKEKEVVVLRHPKNQGKGEALLIGFEFALKKGYDGVLTLDADLQHPPELIGDFLAKKEKNKILLGTRKRNLLNMPFPRFVTNVLTSLIISVIAGKRIYDSQSGYRLIPVFCFKKMRLKSKEYQLESEVLLKGARLGYNFSEVPIPTIYAGSKSYINPFVDTIRFLYILWKSLWW